MNVFGVLVSLFFAVFTGQSILIGVWPGKIHYLLSGYPYFLLLHQCVYQNPQLMRWGARVHTSVCAHRCWRWRCRWWWRRRHCRWRRAIARRPLRIQSARIQRSTLVRLATLFGHRTRTHLAHGSLQRFRVGHTLATVIHL